MDKQNWKTVTTVENEAVAELTKDRLEAAGIPVVLQPGDASAYMGASSPFAINVPAKKLAQAEELLRD